MSESVHAHSYHLTMTANKAVTEALRGVDVHGPAHSLHEAYAVLLEEVDELWHEIKHGTRENVKAEALQVAAVAIRIAAWHDAPREGAQ